METLNHVISSAAGIASALPQRGFAMSHASEVSAARRYGQLLATAMGMSATDAGRLAIVVTEAGTNILKHATEGWLILAAVTQDGCDGVEVLALDRGPGISNVGMSLRDGVSTTGTAGTGLGAMRRQSDDFDIYSAPGFGTAVYVLVAAAPAPASAEINDTVAESVKPAQRLAVGAICLPLAGEEKCGDAWALVKRSSSATIVVSDGLGHGPGAATASQTALAALCDRPTLAPAEMMQAMHEALRPTRGAAAAAAVIDYQDNSFSFAGIGNIAACVVDGTLRRQLVSHNGIVGHNMRKVQAFTVAMDAGACCILCSDGIGTQWDLNRYPGLVMCHPALIAGVLYRDFLRPRDDAMVVVVKRLH